MKAYKRDPSFIEQLICKEEALIDKGALVEDSASRLLDQYGSIRKLAHVQESIERESGRLVKPWFIARVLRKVMDLRYTKVRKIPYQANLDRSLVLRHLYAQKLFELLPTEARIFNVDESWVNDLSWN